MKNIPRGHLALWWLQGGSSSFPTWLQGLDFNGFAIDVCLFLKWILRYMLIDIVTRLRANFDVEFIMQGVLSFTVHPSVIPCNQFFQLLGLAKGSGGRAGWIQKPPSAAVCAKHTWIIRNKEHRAAAEGGGPNGEIVQLMPKVEYTWVGLARV